MDFKGFVMATATSSMKTTLGNVFCLLRYGANDEIRTALSSDCNQNIDDIWKNIGFLSLIKKNNLYATFFSRYKGNEDVVEGLCRDRLNELDVEHRNKFLEILEDTTSLESKLHHAQNRKKFKEQRKEDFKDISDLILQLELMKELKESLTAAEFHIENVYICLNKAKDFICEKSAHKTDTTNKSKIKDALKDYLLSDRIKALIKKLLSELDYKNLCLLRSSAKLLLKPDGLICFDEVISDKLNDKYNFNALRDYLNGIFAEHPSSLSIATLDFKKDYYMEGDVGTLRALVNDSTGVKKCIKDQYFEKITQWKDSSVDNALYEFLKEPRKYLDSSISDINSTVSSVVEEFIKFYKRRYDLIKLQLGGLEDLTNEDLCDIRANVVTKIQAKVNEHNQRVLQESYLHTEGLKTSHLNDLYEIIQFITEGNLTKSDYNEYLIKKIDDFHDIEFDVKKRLLTKIKEGHFEFIKQVLEKIYEISQDDEDKKKLGIEFLKLLSNSNLDLGQEVVNYNILNILDGFKALKDLEKSDSPPEIKKLRFNFYLSYMEVLNQSISNFTPSNFKASLKEKMNEKTSGSYNDFKASIGQNTKRVFWGLLANIWHFLTRDFFLDSSKEDTEFIRDRYGSTSFEFFILNKRGLAKNKLNKLGGDLADIPQSGG